jgi:large subunit ribosomal protein L19
LQLFKKKVKKNIMDLINYVHDQLKTVKTLPKFRAGDGIAVSYRIIEGAKERIQTFKGDVIQINGHGATKTFTVRKMSSGVGVERIFPFSSPSIVEVEILKRGRVRRAKLYYLRDLIGKKSKIREKAHFKR